MSLLSAQPRSIGQVLDSGFKLYFRCFTRIAGIAFISALVGLLPVLILGQPDLSAVTVEALIPFGIAYLVVLIAALGFYSAMLHRTGGIARDSDEGFGAAIATGLRKILVISLASILYVLALLVGSILLLIPGMIFSVTLLFYAFRVVLEGDGPIESLRRSHRLVWGNLWHTAMVLSVAMIIGVAVALGVALPIAYLDVALLGVRFGNGAFAQAADVIATTIIGPYIVAASVALYYDLETRRGEADLAARPDVTAGNT